MSLALAEKVRHSGYDPSPIRPGSAMFLEAKAAQTPCIPKQRPSRPPQLRSKKAVPVLCDTEIKMLKLNINEEEDEPIFKKPIEEESFKTPVSKSQRNTRSTRSRSSSKTSRN